LRYEVVFLNTFLKQFKKLPGNVKERVKQRIQELATNPYLGLGSEAVLMASGRIVLAHTE
jgi:mRNA-degrading endonuclease RelE of RelBE toxin-antitoxin system